MSFFDPLQDRPNAKIRVFLRGTFFITLLPPQVLTFNKSEIISRNFKIVKDIYNMRVFMVELREI
jgi:hypothetical protein